MNLTLDFPIDNEVIKIFIPEPSADRVEGCVEVFSYVYNRIRDLPPSILAKDLNIIVKRLAQNDPAIKINFEALMQESILTMKPVSQFKGKDLLEGQELYNKLEDEDKDMFKALLVFQYALMRYAPQKNHQERIIGVCNCLEFHGLQKAFFEVYRGNGESIFKAREARGLMDRGYSMILDKGIYKYTSALIFNANVELIKDLRLIGGYFG